MSRLDQKRPVTVFLNIALLFFVAIEPHLLNILKCELHALSVVFNTLRCQYGLFDGSLSSALSHSDQGEERNAYDATTEAIHCE
jgi:hypothetical protein